MIEATKSRITGTHPARLLVQMHHQCAYFYGAGEPVTMTVEE
jgi:hypothetical protein